MTAHKPRREGLLARVRKRLFRRQPRFSSAPAVILPKLAVCFDKKLSVSLPADFEQIQNSQNCQLFKGEKSGMYLRLMRIPFRLPLQDLTVTDVQIGFRNLISVNLRPEVTHGYLKHSPMLTAVWTHPPAQKQFMRGNVEVTLKKGEEKTVLRLIQVRETVFLLLFTDVSPEAMPYAEAMLYTVSVDVSQ